MERCPIEVEGSRQGIKALRIGQFDAAELPKGKKSTQRRTTMMAIAQKKSPIKNVSFEPSNSWLKRWDADGGHTVQACWEDNPPRQLSGKRYPNSPIVVSGKSVRRYGEKACLGKHYGTFTQGKENNIRQQLEAILKPEDNLQRLRVSIAFWDMEQAEKLAKEIEGSYNITINGSTVACEVVEAVPMLEGWGTFHLLKNRGQLSRPDTILVDLGFGTSQIWVFADGEDEPEGLALQDLAVARLAQMIADDRTLRGLLRVSASESISLSLVSAAIRNGGMKALEKDVWDSIAKPYICLWRKEVLGYLKNNLGSQMQSLPNIVFTGGGANLMRGSKVAIVPEESQLASVQGAWMFLEARHGG